jgi:hypothetical protein
MASSFIAMPRQPLAQRLQHRRRCGRTPRQTKKASAACSTSMPRPSRPRAPWAAPSPGRACAPGRTSGRPPVRPGASTPAGTGTPPLQAAGAGIDDDVEAAPGCRPVRRPRGRPALASPVAAWRSTRACALAGACGWHSTSAAARPAAAAPARRRRRRRRRPAAHARRPAARRRCARCRAPGRCRRCCRPASRRRRSAACWRPGQRARGVCARASAKASNLNGTVTLQRHRPPRRRRSAHRGLEAVQRALDAAVVDRPRRSGARRRRG